MELKTARLTVLLDPTRKREFEKVCRENDMTPSQVLRRLIRDYMESADPSGRLLTAPAPIVTRPSPVRASRAATPAPVSKARKQAARR